MQYNLRLSQAKVSKAKHKKTEDGGLRWSRDLILSSN